MEQHQVDRFINSSDPYLYEIRDIIRTTNITKQLLIKKIKKDYKDHITPFLINYIDKNYDKYDKYKLSDKIEDLYYNFRENMMNYMEEFGKTPRGYKKSLRRWKLTNYNTT
tara:strand:- start:3094 stop:3426 length:333 start_codon:yes stop_codon:yes gene_type:complete